MLNSNNHDGGAMLLSGTWAAVVGANMLEFSEAVKQTGKSCIVLKAVLKPASLLLQSGKCTWWPTQHLLILCMAFTTASAAVLHFSGLSIESDPS